MMGKRIRTQRGDIALRLIAMLPVAFVRDVFAEAARGLGRAYAFRDRKTGEDSHAGVVDFAEVVAAELVNGYHEHGRPSPPGLCADCRRLGVVRSAPVGRVFYGTQRPSPAPGFRDRVAPGHCRRPRCLDSLTHDAFGAGTVPICSCVCDACIGANLAARPPAASGDTERPEADDASAEAPQAEQRRARRHDEAPAEGAGAFEIMTHARNAARQDS